MQNQIKAKKGVAALLIIVLAVVLLALGAVVAYQYGFGKPKTEITSAVNAPAQNVTPDTVQDRSGDITKLDSGDKISNIELDLNKTDLNTIDKDASDANTAAQGL